MSPASRAASLPLLAALGLALLSGCATSGGDYRALSDVRLDAQIEFPDAQEQIVRGRPNAFLDGLNHYVLSLPTKLLLWNWHILDHELPEESESLLTNYLAWNGLESVHVRHNQYAPGGEFMRLVRNERVGAGYRYTFGIFSWLRYTLLPDRLLAGFPFIGGGDHFNLYSNTINVYSSDPAVLLHEAGHAKDYVRQKHPGTTMGLLRLVPFVDLVQEAYASNDAIGFLKCAHAEDAELEAYKTLFPAYSTYVASYFPQEAMPPLLIAGHISGRIQAGRRERALARADREEVGRYAEKVRGSGKCFAAEPVAAGLADGTARDWADPALAGAPPDAAVAAAGAPADGSALPNGASADRP